MPRLKTDDERCFGHTYADDEDPYRTPPTTGPASLLNKLEARAEVYSLLLWRAGLVVLLLVLIFSARACSFRWSVEDEARCVEACSLSDDTAYQAEGVDDCRCLAPNGDRYNPYTSREVCT